jgi:hypothetical protein
MNFEETEDLKRAMTLIFFAGGIVALVFLVGSVCGCAGTMQADEYTGALVACNKTSSTLEESIKCENDVRAQFHRPLRDAGKE